MSFKTGEDLREEIKKVKSLTDKPFGVNISLVPDVLVTDLITEFVNVILEENVPVVETSGQKPTGFIKPLQDQGIKVIHKCTTIRHALSVEKIGVDAITIIGFEGGGHPGMDDVSGSILFAKAAEDLSVPVIAGGGIVDGKSMYAAMATGVEGVIMATRFLASNEINAPVEFQEAMLDIQENDTILTLRPFKNAFRVWKNELSTKVLALESEGVTIQELLPIISGMKSFEAMQSGDLQNAQISVGQGIGRVNEIKPAGQIVAETVEEFYQTHERMTGLIN